MAGQVIVTGAARGIGAATARRFLQNGQHVALVDRKQELLERTSGELRQAFPGLGCTSYAGDVRDVERIEQIVADLEERHGPVNGLVNNAGYGGPFHRIDEVSDDEWEAMFATNVRSVFAFCRAVLPRMKSHGGGRVVNIASVQGIRGAAMSSTYVACKHAVVGYTRALADEWGPHGVTVNAICPGYVRTTMGIPADATESERAAILDRIPVGRDATPEEIAAMVVHLSGPDSGCVNGAAVVMDGGQSVRF